MHNTICSIARYHNSKSQNIFYPSSDPEVTLRLSHRMSQCHDNNFDSHCIKNTLLVAAT